MGLLEKQYLFGNQFVLSAIITVTFQSTELMRVLLNHSTVQDKSFWSKQHRALLLPPDRWLFEWSYNAYRINFGFPVITVLIPRGELRRVKDRSIVVCDVKQGNGNLTSAILSDERNFRQVREHFCSEVKEFTLTDVAQPPFLIWSTKRISL